MSAWKSLALAGVLLAAPAAFAQQMGGGSPSPGPAAPAPGGANIPDATLQKAGGALHDVVQIQQNYSQKMQSASQNDKQGLADQAQAEAVKAVKNRGLTVEQYNQVIEQARADPGVKQRLIAAAQSAK
jgi:hypothetical protein